VPGAFDHYCTSCFQAIFVSSPKRFQFGELGFVTGAATQPDAGRRPAKSLTFIFLEDLADVFEALVQETSACGCEGHPLGEDGAAAAHDAGNAFEITAADIGSGLTG